ncbi:hypothetical protein E2P81_ATG10122 [Venturia nashicola]|nr:hypothetical protein E2P81_ATG10122 [Venturia nashicola]
MGDRSATHHGPSSPGNAVNIGTSIHGNQYNYLNGQPTNPLDSTERKPCISPANLSTVSTFVDRPILSKEIASKMQKSSGNITLAHALAVTGLGGAGKTQLVLQYFERHKDRYETILWIDAHDEASVRSGYQRCCNALSISLEQKSDRIRLQDTAAVQELHQWLAKRGKDQKWLFIFDNADNLADLSLDLPSNKSAGSVIVTSQDANIVGLLPRAKIVTVDKMEAEEGKALLVQCMDLEDMEAHGKLPPLLEELSNLLDGIALAIDLAGIRIRNDMNSRHELHTVDANDAAVSAIERYFIDFDKHKRSILRENNAVGPYKKTIWTVWETVLCALERFKQSYADTEAFPLQLLKLAALLTPNVMHREVFRSASQSLHKVCAGSVDSPQWFKRLLHLSDDGTWDSFAYDQSVKILMRFHLVRSVNDYAIHNDWILRLDYRHLVLWPGFEMHGLVRWRAREEATQGEYELCRTALVAASCRTSNEHDDGIDFRLVMRGYLPQKDHVWQLQGLTCLAYADLCSTFGTTFLRLRDFHMAEYLLLWAYLVRHELSACFSFTKTRIAVEVCVLFLLEDGKGKCKRFTDFCLQTLTPKERRLFSSNLSARLLHCDMTDSHAVAWAHTAGILYLMQPNERPGSDIKACLREAIRKDAQGEMADQVRELEVGTKYLGKRHDAVIGLKNSLARTQNLCGIHEPEKGNLEDLLMCVKHNLGDKHCQTMQIMERLAGCHARLRNFALALRYVEDVIQLSTQVLGVDDPRTRQREALVSMLEQEEAEQKMGLHERDTMYDQIYMDWLRSNIDPRKLPFLTPQQIEKVKEAKNGSEAILIAGQFIMGSTEDSEMSD